jgi:Rrf2 family protein
VLLPQTAEYALRAVLHVAARADQDVPVNVGDIAAALDVPRNYLSKTLHQLARAGILHSTRGPSGGFRLARAADRIPLAEVIAPFAPAGDADRSLCLLGRGHCRDSTPCAAHWRWKGVTQRMTHFFDETTVADLLRPVPAAPRRAKVRA